MQHLERLRKLGRIALIRLFMLPFLVYFGSVMKLKPVTFRCSSAQLERMDALLGELALSRTAFITVALEQFLDFVEGDEIRDLDLFSLVARLDGNGGPSFAQQA